MPTDLIPAIVNPEAGSADRVLAALEGEARFDVRVRAPREVAAAVRTALIEGHRRIVVAGGDGTIATAANLLVGSEVELAVIPGGTLNHFARDHGIPDDAREASMLAWRGEAKPIDVGRVNGRVFLNTSSVGAYVAFVRARDRVAPSIGYRLATLMAGARTMLSLHRMAMELESPEGRWIYRSPLLFVGVGERELQVPLLGGRVPGGRRGLHVMVVRGRRSTSIVRLGLAAAFRGLSEVGDAGLDELLVDGCTVTLRRKTRVATDGELTSLVSPLRYELLKDAIRLVVPDAIIMG